MHSSALKQLQLIIDRLNEENRSLKAELNLHRKAVKKAEPINKFGSRKNGKTILIIDDEATILEIGQAILQRHGYEVYTATNGEEGMSLYSKFAVDLVLLDYGMPGIGGMRCLKKLLAAKSVGENNMGKLEVRSEGLKPSSPDNKRILDLMVAENKDREDIYKGYAQAHSMNEQDAEGVRHSWAALRRESLKPGEWFQVPMKQKQVEEFLKSNLGARFQKPPAKGAWVQIPSRGKTMPGTTGKTVGSMAL